MMKMRITLATERECVFAGVEMELPADIDMCTEGFREQWLAKAMAALVRRARAMGVMECEMVQYGEVRPQIDNPPDTR